MAYIFVNFKTESKPLSKFKIPKKKRSESESSNNSMTMISAVCMEEPGSDSEPELQIAEVEPEEVSVKEVKTVKIVKVVEQNVAEDIINLKQEIQGDLIVNKRRQIGSGKSIVCHTFDSLGETCHWR